MIELNTRLKGVAVERSREDPELREPDPTPGRGITIEETAITFGNDYSITAPEIIFQHLKFMITVFSL